jgi:hypothetical protein
VAKQQRQNFSRPHRRDYRVNGARRPTNTETIGAPDSSAAGHLMTPRGRRYLWTGLFRFVRVAGVDAPLSLTANCLQHQEIAAAPLADRKGIGYS